MQQLPICIGPIIRIGRESWCLPYAGFLKLDTSLDIKIMIQKVLQPLQICICPTIRIGRESWCLPYAGFFLKLFNEVHCINLLFITYNTFELYWSYMGNLVAILAYFL